MTLKKKILLIYNALIALVFALIPFEESFNAIPNILLIILIALGLFIIKRAHLFKFIKENIHYRAYIIFTILICVTSLLNACLIQDIFFFKKILIIAILLPLSVPIKSFRYCKLFFIVSVLIAILISLFNLIIEFYDSSSFDFSKGAIINNLLVGERLYLSLMCVISLIFSLNEISSYCNNYRYLHLANSGVIIIFLLIITARIALISSVIILTLFMVKRLSSKERAIGFFSIFLLFTALFVINPNLSKRFFHVDHVFESGFIEKIKKHEPRYDIWYCSYQAINFDKSFFIGHGFSVTKNLLSDCFEKRIEVDKRKKWFIESRFNTHNQFIDLLLGGGISVLISFVIVFLILLTRIKLSFQSLSILILMVLFMSIENILHRQMGCYILAFCLICLEKEEYKLNNHV